MIEIKLDLATLREVLYDNDCNISVNVDDEVEELLKTKLADGFSTKVRDTLCLTPQVNGLVAEWVRRLVETEVGNYLRVGQQDIHMEVMKQVGKQFEKEVESAVRCRMKKLSTRVSDLLDQQQSKINDELET